MTITTDRRTELLAAAPLFAAMDPDGIERIAARVVEVEFASGHVIAHQGEIGTGFFQVAEPDPAALILTCANCGAAMDERKCKLICRCGYFLSCSDNY